MSRSLTNSCHLRCLAANTRVRLTGWSVADGSLPRMELICGINLSMSLILVVDLLRHARQRSPIKEKLKLGMG